MMPLCPKCKTPPMPGMVSCRLCGHPLPPAADGDMHASAHTFVPWEHIAAFGVAGALGRTIILALLKPGLFFRQLTRPGNTHMAWLFAAIAGSAGLLLAYLWTYVFAPATFETLETLGVVGVEARSSAETALVTAPIVISAQVIALAVYCHVLLKLFGLNKHAFAVTFKVACYAQSGALLQALPIIGGIASFAWTLYLVVTGLSETNRLGRLRVFLLMVLPAVLIAMLVLVVIMAAVMLLGAGIVANSFLKDIFDILR
ncbi:MAG: hypothetical protein GF418_05935 [Chitinivibrionales bacterium]|nr:hypothetical protein [Chitinivibrionales bacterium]MBD3395151.1 hypothetical protein [Chitinivibrionales bacterium]